jgi:hypothetical protein
MSRPEDVTMPFGKHQGKTLSQIVQDDAAYIDYLMSIELRSPKLAHAVVAIHKKYAAEIERAVGDD